MGRARVDTHHTEVRRTSARKANRRYRCGADGFVVEAVCGFVSRRRLLPRNAFSAGVLGRHGSTNNAGSCRTTRLAAGATWLRQRKASVSPAHYARPREGYANRFVV